ncbi:hypothetical protein D3C81_2191800 [compost metagenome]
MVIPSSELMVIEMISDSSNTSTGGSPAFARNLALYRPMNDPTINTSPWAKLISLIMP